MTPESARTVAVEFHFQEIFRGESVELLVGGEVRARVEARTRFTTGLAHIETLELELGEEVTVRIPESGLEATVEIGPATPFVVVRLEDGLLRAHAADARPGYL